MEIVEEKGVINKTKYDALNEEEKLLYWQIGKNKFKLMSELDNAHLQNAFCYAQTKELLYHNKYTIFNELVNQIESEAVQRGITLNDLDTAYHKKSRKQKGVSFQVPLVEISKS